MDLRLKLLHLYPSENIVNLVILGSSIGGLSTDTGAFWWNYLRTNYSEYFLNVGVNALVGFAFYWIYSLFFLFHVILSNIGSSRERRSCMELQTAKETDYY